MARKVKKRTPNLAKQVADLGRPVLQRLSIQDYRSCLDAAFAPTGGISVLIGPNGAGKTTLLNAIQLLPKLCTSARPGPAPTVVCSLRARFAFPEGQTATLIAKIGLDTDEHNRDVVVASEQSWYLPDFTGSKRHSKFPLSLVTEPFRYFGSRQASLFEPDDLRLARHFPQHFRDFVDAAPPLTAIGQFLNDAAYFSAAQFTDPTSCPASIEIDQSDHPSWTTIRRLKGHAKFLSDLYAAFKTPSGQYQEFAEVVGPKGIHLVDEITFQEFETSSVEYAVRSGGRIVKKDKKKSLIVPQFHIGGNRLSPNQLSEGTFKTIALLFYIMTTQSSVLMVEEPEVCVHHGLLASIIGLIKSHSADKQIILSTHSEAVLDRFLPEQVFVVTRHPETGTAIGSVSERLSRDSLSELRRYLEEEGNLGEFWRHGGLE